MNSTTTKANFGNWVSKRLIVIPALVTIVFLGLALIYPVSIMAAAFFFIVFAYFAYARHLFSQQGGNVQAQIHELVFDYLDWDGSGEMIDIGCGNGPLTMKAARKYPQAHITGIDYWGGMWEYSQQVCEENAEIEGVSDRVTFQKASASALPFGDEVFDAAISNLVFHEVSDTRDKRLVIREALRVVKKGGVFAFQDLFLERRIYGETDDLLETIRNWDIEQIAFYRSNDSEFIPWALKLPFMVGTMGIIYGRK